LVEATRTDYQMLRVYRRSPSGFTQVVSATYSSAINPGIASNHIRAMRIGSTMTLYVNGTMLGAFLAALETPFSFCSAKLRPGKIKARKSRLIWSRSRL
jgi:hypothetical protein